MRDEYKKLFNFITMANINPYLKKVITYQCLPDRNNYYEIKRLMDYYHVDTYGELLDILAQEYNYGDISEYINEAFYDRTLNNQFSDNNFDYIFLKPMNEFLSYSELSKFMKNFDKDLYNSLTDKERYNTIKYNELELLKEYRKNIGQYAEYRQFYHETRDLDTNIIWVSRDVGDGFGFDFIRNERTNGVRLIEVKGSTYRSVLPSLTSNEYKEFKYAVKRRDTNYSIFNHCGLPSSYAMEEYKYDKIRKVFSCSELLAGITFNYSAEFDFHTDSYKLKHKRNN